MKIKETPLIRQYNQIKSRYPGAILLFRVGDFYETFGKDAIKTSEILDIVLTKRSNGAASSVELAGFPYHALDNYVSKLLKAGQRIAVCDQLEDPKYAKGLVKRGITELITPGLAYHDNVLEKKSNNFLASIHIEKENIGIAMLDLSTGEFIITQGNTIYIKKILESFEPKEVLFSKKMKRQILPLLRLNIPNYNLEDWAFQYDYAYEKLNSHFKTKSLKGFGIEDLLLGITASGAIMRYLEETENKNIQHINTISRIDSNKYVWLDQFTIKNLELICPQQPQGIPLIKIIDKTITPMGARLLKKWVLLPLKELKEVNERLDSVDSFLKDEKLMHIISEALKQISDLERLAAKIGTQKIYPREVIKLKNSLKQLKPIKDNLKLKNNLINLSEEIKYLESVINKIESSIKEDPSVNISQGGVIKQGINKELDELLDITEQSESYLEKLKQKQIKETGINSLKIAYNKVFGYYIEVTNAHKNKVPKDWVRKQTLVNAERYITEDLKYHEEKILTAKEKIIILEQTIFRQLTEDLAFSIKDLQNNSKAISKIDCYLSLAKVSKQNNYVKPIVNEKDIIDIKEGRHPVIEQTLDIDKYYVPNDIYLDKKEQQIIIITGPNMAGKSALLRQVALITILAQIGCFVPAKSATIGLVDKIFTRVGASDNLAKGESTFMVEMNETACILNNLTNKSLVIMDEIGRGTSTYDGISIAQAIVEFLHEHKYKPKTLFATHYHELNEIESSFPRLKNYNVEVKEKNSKIIFMYKLIKGGSEHSFGINVAKMAGIPFSIINRSKVIMKILENKSNKESKFPKEETDAKNNFQLKLFEISPYNKKIKEEFNKIDIDNLSPIEALLKLDELKKIIE